MLRMLVFLLLAIGAYPAGAQTAHSLGDVPDLLKTPEGRQSFAQEIEGKPAPDGLGVRLPARLSAQQIAALLIPATDKTPPSLVGAKPLPGAADTYVAIVCTSNDRRGTPDAPVCDQSDFGTPRPDMKSYLGIIEAKDGAAPRLLAGPTLVDGKVDWRDTNLKEAPSVDDGDRGRMRPQTFDGFDLAPYEIAPGKRAFGLRAGWSEGYAGGGASFGALYLFAVVDGALRQILAVPMSFSKNIAGEWHKDGTRDHDISEGANVLIVTTDRTDGYFDLQLRSRTDNSRRLLKWSAATSDYRFAGK